MAIDKKTPGTVCRLCARPGYITSEDIVPTWLRKHIIRTYGPFPDGRAPRRIKTRICRSCNGGLGRLFENSAPRLIRPLVDGEDVNLTPDQQSFLGGWITKTSIMGNFAGANPSDWGYDLSRSMLSTMMASGHPPVGTSVRIAYCDPWNNSEGVGGDIRTVLPGEMAPLHDFFAVTTLGFLAWEMVTGLATYIYPYIEQTDRLNSNFVRIWPPRKSVVALSRVNNSIDHGQKAALREAFMRAALPGMPGPYVRKWVFKES